MTDHLQIRPAGAGDVEALAALAARTFRDTFAADNTASDMEAYVDDAFAAGRVEAELVDADHTFLLAFAAAGGEAIGYAKLRSGSVEASVAGPAPVELERLYVDRCAIGGGVGAALMGACLAAAWAAGHRTLWLGVWEHNARAIAFYQRWGFRTVGAHAFQLGADLQTDLIMQRPVPAPR